MTAHSHTVRMDNTTLVGIVGGIATIATAFIAGLWQHLSGRKKSDIDAQGALVSGFIALLAELKGEMTALRERTDVLENKNQKQGRRIGKLERIMSRHNIEIPENGI